jgi:outer membrane receptor for Fe3+-dicitrate
MPCYPFKLRLRVTLLTELAVLFSVLGGSNVHAQTPQPTQATPTTAGDLTRVSIENLMNIDVTSVSKKEQKLSQVAAAIFVITQEDIRRSGATNIPDLLRMVPGLDVAQINGSMWAIGSRGLNEQFSDKILVTVDGRFTLQPFPVFFGTPLTFLFRTSIESKSFAVQADPFGVPTP